MSGKIALVSRGTCNFSVKTLFAGGKGAVGTIIYNNDQPLGGTLGAEGTYPITAMIAKDAGLKLVADLKVGPKTATLEVTTISAPTYNVLAQTKGGDQNNVILAGGHSDSVKPGEYLDQNCLPITNILQAPVSTMTALESLPSSRSQSN